MLVIIAVRVAAADIIRSVGVRIVYIALITLGAAVAVAIRVVMLVGVLRASIYSTI